MSEQIEPKDALPRFFGYPKAVEGPDVPFKKANDKNPVFGDLILVVGAWLVSKLEFVQKILWSNAGFNGLRGIHFGNYTARWDPLVIPVSDPQAAPYTPELSPSTLQVLPEKVLGRYHSVAEYHAKYLSGELTPLAVAESLLPLIRRDVKNPSPHSIAFISTNVDFVLAAAKSSTARYQAGNPLGLLDGVPTAVKDEADVEGYRTTNGTRRSLTDSTSSIAKGTSWPVQTIQRSGCIVMGKLNMHELGADTTNNNPNWGTPKNPHNDRYYTGGSSGGSAYTVSTGLLPFSLGADGGGSIRIPASFCGIYGLKPSHGRLEDTGSTVAVSGPLAASMADLEAAYRVLGQPNPDDPTGALFAAPNPSASTSSRHKVIGIFKEWFNRADKSVLDLCQKTVDYYRDVLKYEVVDITIPYCSEGQSGHAFTILSEMANHAKNHVGQANRKNWLSGLNPANKILLAVGSQTPAQDYILAQKLRNVLMQHLAWLFKKHPGMIIVSPTTPMPGWSINSDSDLKYGVTDGNTSIRNMEYVWLANFCGNPAISCPVGYVEPTKGNGKVPIGIMGMGDWGSEDQLLGFGREAEIYLNEVYEGGRQRPAAWVDVLANAVVGSEVDK
ncbi:amidase signature domain-containing protein [Amylocarpus encephaloides]|uniref:Amidase signature domain-containing protein n=1 Tax=Amylocarpus encephaloides TaxID=45428 RepID=A0A9P8C730_9HELO|nr:amidase signature domain-containing protein [Amylocarpus encephaloides]